MFTRKTRIVFAALATVVAIVVLPASSFAIKAKPTGDPKLDDYCQQAAALIDRAITQGNLALVNGDDDGASEWYHLAAEMITRSQAQGCQFARIGPKVRHVLKDRPDLGPPVSSSDSPQVGTSPTGSAGGIRAHLPDIGLVPIATPTS